MKILKKILPAAAVGSATILGLGVTATPAHAASLSCTNLANGQLCVHIAPGGYDISYQKWGGGPVYLDFNLWCANGQWAGDQGSFWENTGETRSYVFQVGYLGACQGVLIDGYSRNVLATTDYVS